MNHKLSVEQVSTIFSAFAERECKGVSDLYYHLSHAISLEEPLLSIARHCQPRQPIPNLFCGAIHLELLKNPKEKLAQYYPSISKKRSTGIPIELVKAFCKRREREILETLRSRMVQTNSINRSAYLMPILSSSFQQGDSVTLIDIGTSSGLTLNFDKYEYWYNGIHHVGDSTVKINSKILEGGLPPFDTGIRIVRKIGLDQNPLDVTDRDNALWLKALIWPDMTERFARIEAAIDLANHSNLKLKKAQSPEDFREILDEVPNHENLFVYHTHVLYQFTKPERTAFREMLERVGQNRDFVYVAVEGSQVFDNKAYSTGRVLIEKTVYRNGKGASRIIGETNGHATWIRWK